MTKRPASPPGPQGHAGSRLGLALLGAVLVAVVGMTAILGGGRARAVAFETHTVDVSEPSATTDETVPAYDPDLERRIAEDVAAYVNSERRARSLPLLDLVADDHARTANEARLRDLAPDDGLLDAYAATAARELFVRLGTGTRSGEAVAGWLANEHGAALLDRDATSIAVAAACQPGDRGGDLVLTVHVLTTDAGPAVDPPTADDRPGAGRGEACQFADLALGPTATEGMVVPAALAAASALTLALALLELQRRRHNVGFTELRAPVEPDEPDPPPAA
ncbi:hypothetical protein [Egicoccus sp. AB-alg6-2]|uniref:hypothetical protein n=1 Tax=Egicoccus sp. AB-alg6-2 TaxID=3242692 RepID=UPI00359DFD76